MPSSSYRLLGSGTVVSYSRMPHGGSSRQSSSSLYEREHKSEKGKDMTESECIDILCIQPTRPEDSLEILTILGRRLIEAGSDDQNTVLARA